MVKEEEARWGAVTGSGLCMQRQAYGWQFAERMQAIRNPRECDEQPVRFVVFSLRAERTMKLV